MNLQIENKGLISNYLLQKGIHNFAQLIHFLKYMPYGRNTQRENPLCILSEGVGTCSTKHGLIKLLAEEQNWQEIKLILCLFKISAENTPKIANILIANGISYLPEAHCYILKEGEAVDVTNESADFEAIKSAILYEESIEVAQLGDYKVHFHQKYIREWIVEEGIPFSFKEIWKIREDCIKALGN